MRFNFYQKVIVIAAILSINVQSSFAQKGFFKSAVNARMDLSKMKDIEQFSIYNLRTNDLRSYLLNAPLEFKKATVLPLELEIPLPDGQVETFHILESPVISAEVAAKHPEIKTYSGRGTTKKNAVIRISFTAAGFNAIVLTGDGDAVYFEKHPGAGAETYYNYFAKDGLTLKNTDLEGGIGGNDFIERPQAEMSQNLKNDLRGNRLAATGGDLSIFRLALAANGNFTQKHGGTTTSAYAALVEYTNRLNAFFRNELSIGFTLVNDETKLVYTNPETDPYKNSSNDYLDLNANQRTVDAVIGAENYDIAHMLGYVGSTGAGIASNGVCENGYKAWGVSLEGNPNAVTQVFNDKLIFHEIGHQFRMNHSYNSNISLCTSRNTATSVEPGAGISVMSYAMICYDGNVAMMGDNYHNFNFPEGRALLQYHSASYQEAVKYIRALPAAWTKGVVVISSGNTPPIITVPGNYTIPKSTPFELAGSATDAQGDGITYIWEGTNTGGAELPTSATLEDTSKPPFSRTYAPSSTGNKRTFPILSGILDGTNTARADKLPSVAATLTYNLTARDNNPAGGGVSFGTTTVIVDGNSGPFVITNDNEGSSFNLVGNKLPGAQQTITWSVNNTNVAPINCTLVDIFLSTDGGLTFPQNPLLAAAPNNGTAVITWPFGINVEKARIKIASSKSAGVTNGRVGAVTAGSNTPNIFFDISNVDFSIRGVLPVTFAAFNVELKNKNNAVLTWSTATETNNAGFDIEMSTDARNFTKIGFVEGKGDSKNLKQYDYTISDLAGGNYYFRLKQLDYDGEFDYSTIKALSVEDAGNVAFLYPNPSNGILKFNAGVHQNEIFKISILNESGKEVLSFPSSADYSKGTEINVAVLPTGLYNVTIRGAVFVENLKFVKL